ncbi:MAG: nucleotidyl transferase AbiEii/AbiGii toxin family protein, partial [Acidobacteriota bacterium]|nr:nucleotidyl transferase AbiEii/AbiGii toxin family protein [Acidobacteriota bacterium]
YMLTGSMALSHYAEPRFTRDIDLVVQLATEQVERLVALFAADCYADADAIRAAVGRHGMTNLLHLDTMTKIDLIVRKPTPYHAREFDRRRAVIIEGTAVWIVSPEDLVISKLSWIQQGGSDVHRRDIASLLAAVDTMDRPYIDTNVRELQLADLWKTFAE